MKAAGKKIPRGTVLLFLSFTAISLCLLLIVSAIRAERTNSMGRRGMYSGHQKNFSVYHAETDDQWEDVIPKLGEKYNNFAIYLPIQDPEIVVKGVCVRGKAGVPPMIEGQYFDFAASWSDVPKAVLGRQYQKDVVQRKGKTYFTYQNIEFEVIGIMGIREESRLNYMMMIDFKSAVRLTGINTSYVLDTRKESGLTALGEEISSLFCLPAEVSIMLEKGDAVSPIARFLSGDGIMDAMYGLLLVSFSLSTILVTFIWLRFRGQLFYAWRLCGYKSSIQSLEISKRFYLAAGGGFATGLLLMALLSLVMEDVHMAVSDVFQALGITIGLGTVILFFCYRIDRKKTKT